MRETRWSKYPTQQSESTCRITMHKLRGNGGMMLRIHEMQALLGNLGNRRDEGDWLG